MSTPVSTALVIRYIVVESEGLSGRISKGIETLGQ
jgi:hypothetical protein